MIKGMGHNELEVQNYKEFMENCGNETFYRIMEKRDMEQFHEVFAGYETYQLSPEVGMKHSEILTGLDLEQRMSIQFRSMIYKPRRMICNPKST